MVPRMPTTRNGLTLFKFPKFKVLNHVKDPLVLDRSVDLAAAITWFIFALWGLVASITGLETIVSAAGPLYAFLWAGGIGTFASIACASAISLFFDLGYRLPPPFKKKIELWAVRSLSLLLGVYPLMLFIAGAFNSDGSRFITGVLTLSLLVFPLFRIHVLKTRIKTFIRAQKELLTNGDN